MLCGLTQFDSAGFPEEAGCISPMITTLLCEKGVGVLFADDFDQDAFAAFAVEFAVEDLFPGAEIEFAGGDGANNLTAHDGAFEMGVGVVFAGVIVVILGIRLFGGEFFEPAFPVFEETGLIVVDENGGGDVHGVDEDEAIFDAGGLDGFLDVAGDVDEAAAVGEVEPEFLTMGLHEGLREQSEGVKSCHGYHPNSRQKQHGGRHRNSRTRKWAEPGTRFANGEFADYNNPMIKRLGTLLLIAVAGLAGGCTSHIVPLAPVREVQEWQPDEAPATAPATQESAATAPETAPAETMAASAPAATIAAATTTAPATQPGRMVKKIIDPNQMTRFIYKATYDTIWQQATLLLSKMEFLLDRRDYRLGAITTQPLASSQIVEFWKPQTVNATDAMENTVNSQRRTVRLTISKVEGKPDFYEIAVQVLVERQTNPSESLGGPIYVQGSGFGRDAITLRSDYATPNAPAIGGWYTYGHDPDMEKKILDELFKHI